MIKLAIIISTLKNTGPTRVCLNLLTYIDKTVFDVYVITLSKEPNDSLLNEFKALGVKLHQINHGRLEGIYKNILFIRNLIRDLDIDIIHSHGFRPDIYSVFMPVKIKVSTLHNIPFVDYVLKYGKLKGRIMSFIHIFFLKLNNSLFVVFCSNAIKDSIINIEGDVIVNGIDTEFFYPEYEKVKYFRNKFNIDKKVKRIFISTGSLIPRKNLKTLVNAFNKLDQEKNLLIILGNGPELKTLKLISNSGILYLGKQKDVRPFLQISDFFVSASFSEGLPNAVLEALACGTNCILSDIRSHREILFNKSEIFFAPDDIDKLYNLLKSSNIQKVKRDLNYNFCQQHFSAKAMAFSYGKLYKSFIDNE